MSQEGIGSAIFGDPCQGARFIILGGCSLPRPPNPSFNSPRPLLAGQAQLDNWEPGKAQPRSLARAKSHKPQCLHFSTPPPPGLRVVCREGKGRRWRLQVISSRTSHPLASSGGQGGCALSHEASLPSVWAPHLGTGRECDGQITLLQVTLFALSGLLLLLQALPLENENSWPPGNHPKATG